MTFDRIPPHKWLFIDANIFIYYFAPDPVFGAACRILME